MTEKLSGKKGVTAEELRDALAITVNLIDKFGDEIWPLFERFERELKQVESREVRLAKYRRKKPVAAKTPPARKLGPGPDHYKAVFDEFKKR